MLGANYKQSVSGLIKIKILKNEFIVKGNRHKNQEEKFSFTFKTSSNKSKEQFSS